MTSQLPRGAFLTGLCLAALACGAPSLSPQAAPRTAQPAPAGTESPSPAAGRSPTSREAAAIQRLERVTSRLRGLQFSEPVDTRIHSQDEIRSFLAAELEQESLPESLELLAALGLVGSAEEALAQLTATLGEQVVGYYDARNASLVVRDDAAVSLGEMRISSSLTDPGRLTLVHELVHALQDQRLGLGEIIDSDFEHDGALAYRSLIEGDATLVTLGAGASQRPDAIALIAAQADQIQSRLGGAMSSLPGQQLSSAPPIFRALLMGPYLHGMVFVARLYHEGGWDAVNAAYANPPRTMAEVLHIERYRERARLVTIPPPELTAAEEAGLRLAHDETLGELGFAVYLAGNTADTALNWNASEGWRADRTELWTRPNGPPVAISWSVWDNETQAREAEDAAESVSRTLSADERRGAIVGRAGPCLVIARGAPPELQAPIMAALNDLHRAILQDFPDLRH